MTGVEHGAIGHLNIFLSKWLFKYLAHFVKAGFAFYY
jgi:hypothetical protein